MFSFTRSVCFPFGSYPWLYWSFWLQEEGPCLKSIWQRWPEQKQVTRQGPGPLTRGVMYMTPLVTLCCWQRLRFGKDEHFRATGDNQTPYQSVKHCLDYAKGLFEYDTEANLRWHRKCLVAMIYSTWRRPNCSKCNQHTLTGLSASGEGRGIW